MIKEHLICVKQILDNLVTGIYKGMGYIVIFVIVFGLCFFFVYPYYFEYEYIENCLQKGYEKNLCEKNFQDFLEMN